VGLAWFALVVTVGATASIVEAASAQSRTTIEGTLTLSAIALFPGIVCLVLSWVFSPPREDDDGGRD
jgi:predicted benzoate:H+ symporter BenE